MHHLLRLLATTLLLQVILLRTCKSHQEIQFLGQSSLIAYVSRATPPNSTIYSFVAVSTVDNRPDGISYSLIEGSYDPNLVQINDTGHLIILQYLPLGNWTVRVQAVLGQESARANLSVIVLPEHNLLPVFEQNEYSFSLSEYTPINSLFAVVRAFSLDPESYEHSYSIISGNTGNDLAINVSTGALYIARQLDYETTSAYHLTVQYSDSGAQVSISVAVLVLDENDNAPVFSEVIYESTLNESVPIGYLAVTVLANDRDSGENGMAEYFIVEDDVGFEIEETMGDIRTTVSLDYEEESVHSFTVVARDHGQPALTSTVIVTVRVLNEDDECPVFESVNYFVALSPPESPGMEVVTVHAVDPDGMSDVTYSFGSDNPPTALSLDQHTGTVTLSDTSSDIYTFLVFASDAGCADSDRPSAEVVINIQSNNSYRPQFAGPCEAQILENSPGGAIVTTLIATDDDAGVFGEITYEFTDVISEFILDPDTGVVTLSDGVNLDYEEKSSYLLSVTATDTGSRQAYCLLNITVLDENDNEPVFFTLDYQVSISLNTTPGAFVVQTLADDADDGSNRVIEYSLLDSGTFVIDSTNGVITTVVELTEEDHMHSLTVQASNNLASPTHSTSASLTVHVVSDSDIQLPVFNQSQYSATICENLPVSTSVLQVFPTTDIVNIHYNFLSGSQYYTNSDNVFEIHPDGTITVSSQGIIDYEQLPDSMFQFSVQSVNFNDGNTLSISTIEIVVLDSEDNGPHFQSGVVSSSVAENEPAGTLVVQLAATDPDSGTNGDIRLIIDSDLFAISESGNLTTLAQFDAENMPEMLFVPVSALNPNTLDPNDHCSPLMSPFRSATALVSVTILDVNDNPPSFENPSPTLSLPENTTQGTIVFEFIATDEDVSGDPLSYTIINGNTNKNFFITDTGALILFKSLDYETSPLLTLTVQVSDGIFTVTASLTIFVTNVDDESPQFSEALYSTTIIENTQHGPSVLQVSTTDIDTENISYWLTGTAEGRFSINSSGIITVVGVIDREEFEDGVISFLVVAQGGPIATALVNVTVIDVNDCVPRFSNTDLLIVQENVPPDVAGIYVGRVTAMDSDTGRNGELSYTLLNGAEDGFIINQRTGEVFAHSMYDREVIPFYTLAVEATDQGESIQLSSTATFLVKIGDVNDNAPFFPFPYIFKRIFEDSIIGREVIELPAIDFDEGTNAALTFVLLSSEPDMGTVFELDTLTGLVTLAKPLDYETLLRRPFTLTFSVSDSIHSGDTVATLEIEVLDVNDNAPTLHVMPTSLGLSIAESVPVDTDILQLTASDEDSGTNAEIIFSIISGDPNEDFVITAAGNEANVSTAHQLDYEMKDSYNLVIQACDQGKLPKCIKSETNITIENIDDVVPSFTQPLYEGSVTENTDPTISILQVNATGDPDFGNIFEYKIESGNSGGKFSINSTTGIIHSTVALDREEQETYVLVITAADEGGTPLSGTGTAVITVLDVNDNPPANDSQWEVHMLLLDGHLPEEHSIDFYFSDPDLPSTYADCLPIDTQHTGTFFLVNPASCMLLLKEGNIPENADYSIKVLESKQEISSGVNIVVDHIQFSDIPTDHLVTISLAMSAASYLNSSYTSFPEAFATVLGIELEMLHIVSIQSGYHDAENTVDISLFAERGDDTYIDPVLILQTLYIQRDSIGYELSALPTDPCSSEPCISQASCKSFTSVLDSSVTVASPSLVLVSPIVELGYECECIPGTSGENCSIDFDDCYSNPCQFGAQCIDQVNGFKCVCPSGTSGVDCSVSPNGCSSDPCQNGATCKNTPGSHACICLPGYYGSDCQYQYFRTATTCDSSPCQNGGTCSPGRDSFTCLCSEGHSGQLCELQATSQGCLSNPCYNGSTCIDSEDGPVCLCSVGFTGPRCRWQIDNCELGPCRNGGTCATGLYGSYQCYCPTPYTGETCEDFILGCDSSPCLNGGRCTDTGGGNYTCECIRGYSGDNCEHAVQPLDLCSDNPCLFGNCTYGLDAYTCSCLANYSGVHCENESPPSTPCSSNPCQHGGTCEDSNGDFICTCSQGFTGTNCERNVDDCNPDPCIHGVCKDGISGYICECTTAQITGYNCDVYCPNGQSGDFCEVVTLQCEINENPCKNGGSCIEGPGSYSCICPPTHTGPVCEQENTCDIVQCLNEGTCSALEDGGYGCACNNGFDGPNCQLVTISFSAISSTNSYRAYPSLHLSARGSIEFEFNTVDSDGLLLYNTQLQDGHNRDYIAVEISSGQLVVGISHGEDAVSLVPVTSVSDGQWHHVSIGISEKSVSVTLDFCHDLDDVVGASAGCYLTGATLGQSTFLDLGLPLWLGGSPSSSSTVSGGGTTACMRQVYINHILLDLNSHLDQSNSQPGCPQLDDQCVSGECGAGDCIATWSTRLCACPTLLSGDLCDTGSPSLSFMGNGYAHYTLTEEGTRLRRQADGDLRSTYTDRVSLSLRTTHSDGLLFSMYDKTASEYLYIALESGQVVVYLNLGGGEESVLVLGPQLNDSQRHSVSVDRTGQHLNISVDSSTVQGSLPPGTPLTLETLSSEIYTGGSPHTSSWFTGCLQDVRINRFSLPTSGSNTLASVVYEGSGGESTGVTEGCILSPCYDNPCGSGGTCVDGSNISYECVCSGGERLSTVCPQTQEEFQYTLHVAGAGILVVLIVIISITLVAGVCVWRSRRKKRTYLIGVTDKMDSQELAEVFMPSQTVVISNEQGGGEEDAEDVDWAPLALKCGSSTGKSSPPSSSQAASSKDSPASRASHNSKASTEVYQFRLPVPKKEQKGVRDEDDDREVKSNSPVIRAYLEERVNTANDDILSVDSLHEFCEEGSEDSEVDSLSSVLSSEDEEEYTLERLNAAGPPLSSLAPLLEHVLQSTAQFSTRVTPSASDIMLSSYTTQ